MQEINSKIKIFPDDYVLIHKLFNPQTTLVYDLDKNRLLERLGRQKEKYDFIDIKMDDYIIFLALCGFKIFEKPRKAKSSKSDAFYLASGLNEKDGFLLQYLPPNSQTSKHYHRYRDEAYHSIAGSAIIWTNNGILKLENGNSQQTKPFVHHQIITQEKSSLVLLEMIDEKPDLGMTDHIYV